MASTFSKRFSSAGTPLGMRLNGESVEVWFGYYDSTVAADANHLETLTALVHLGESRQGFRGGDEVLTDGSVTFSETDISRADLQANGELRVKGVAYPVRSVHLKYQEIDYHIDSVDPAEHGLIRCHVIANDKRYSNSPQIDSIV